MTTTNAVQTIQKMSRVWSSKRECEIAVRIQYQVHIEDGCKIYQLGRVEELE
jgi:hypothetical protein